MGAEGVVSIAIGSKSWAAQIRKRSKEVAKQLDTSRIEMGRLLWLIYDTPIDGDKNKGAIYKNWGYASLSEYAEGELEINSRTAQRLCNIGRMLDHDLVGLDKKIKDRLVKVGWGKLYELSKLFKHKNDKTYVEKWIERAEGESYPALLISVQKAQDRLGQKNGETVEDVTEKNKKVDDKMDLDKKDNSDDDELPEAERTKTISFLLVDEQIDNVVEAFDRAAELIKEKGEGHRSRSARLSLICLDFLMNNDFKKAHDPEMRKRYLHKLEMLMGVKLVAIDEKGKVFYGLRTLHKLADD